MKTERHFDHYTLLAIVFEHIAKELRNPDSEFRKNFMLSWKQALTMLQLIRIITAPGVQIYYIGDVERKWHVDRRTIRNWIDMGYLHHGHKRAVGDTRVFWYASELDEAEDQLIEAGYLKKRKGNVMRMIERARSFLKFEECGE